MSDEKCQICNDNPHIHTCTNKDCKIKFCLPCAKVYNKEGKITNSVEDVLKIKCPKCLQWQ